MKIRLRPYCFRAALLCLLFALTSCGTPGGMADSLPTSGAFLANFEEETYSEILQRQQRIVLQIELIDTVRPPQRLSLEHLHGYVVPAGSHRVQFRVLLPSTGWTDSRDREARGFFDVELAAGHRYRLGGIYGKKPYTFHLVDLATNQPVSPAIDLGFFSPVQQNLQFVPLIVPIKI